MSGVLTDLNDGKCVSLLLRRSQYLLTFWFFPQSNYWVHAHLSGIKYKLSRFRSNYLWRQKSPRRNPKMSPGAFGDLCSAIQEDVAWRSEHKSRARTWFSSFDTLIIYISARVQVKCQWVTALVSAGTELTLLLVAGTVLCFGFSVGMMLITLWCLVVAK